MKKRILFILLPLCIGAGSVSAQETAPELLRKGIQSFRQEKFDEAIAAFTKAIAIDPGNADAYNGRGMAFAEKDGTGPQALADFNKAITLDPHHDKAYHNRGIAYKKRGILNQAIADYTKALENNPNLSAAYYDRAVAYFFKKEYDKAWDDVHNAELLGYGIKPEFLADLIKASGRKK